MSKNLNIPTSTEGLLRSLESFLDSLEDETTPATKQFVRTLITRIKLQDSDTDPTFTLETLALDVAQSLYYLEIARLK
ncbi:hypothetical protein [Bifidobacterium bombi]|uniref:hypothetical protein n=1 Tax=Bifidobacterium bombi TaxID=471511 RepID=UPI001269E3DE|nr:hypothetical protein [Bifidobacterium bombi]